MLVNNSDPIYYWEAPSVDEIGATIEEFLEQLTAPTWIYIPGRDHSRCRAITTLLHGNEPSGLHAIHAWLRSGDQPETDLYFCIASVKTAQHPPGFFYRMLPDCRDLNRCFRPPYKDAEGVLAANILRRLCAVQPEAVLDIHNTSGSGPSFAVVTNTDRRHKALASLFTQHLIITDLKLGAIMEFEEGGFPITTIECGGCHDPHAHQLATEGLRRFALKQNLFNYHSINAEMVLYKHPLRVEMIEGSEIAYADHPIDGPDLTLHSDVEHFNFGEAPANSVLGWLGPRGINCLTARDSMGSEHIEHYFEVHDNQLLTRQPLRLFMVTKNPSIALSDCLFYLVPVDDCHRHQSH
ncbi:DevC-like ABC transporter permease component [gamma proteobacterium IMCC2047]|nr:DevC-like ABC transporter permease component [gamma proteobacterium IMCC2047]